MAYWKMFNIFIVLTLFVMIQETFCDHSFVISPIKLENLVLRRYRRDDNNVQASKPVVKSLHIDTVIKYRYANTVVYSKLQNTANESREIGFSTVLPDAAFISGFAITINGTVYKAYVKEKEEAKRIYQEAVSAGSTAGHVELSARDSNTFTVSVNVEAFGKVDFNLTYEELLSRDLGTYKHKLNLNPGQLVKDMKVQVIIHESSNITTLIVPELRENNEILDDAITENQSVIKEQPNGTTAIITWSPSLEQQEEINRDGVKGLLEVRYDVDRVSQPNQILVNEGYFVHFFAPPDLTPLDKHVVFVLDRSGSMYGRKIIQVQEAMSSILDELRSGDSFSILLFSDNLRLWKSDGQELVPENLRGEPLSPLTIASATPENIQAAKTLVSGVEASGGTHIYDALQTALRVVQLGSENNINKEPIIIFLTDGQPNGPNSNPESIITDTTRGNKNLSAVIYGLAFGNDADFNLLKKLALKNSGFARKIYEASDASLQLKHFYKEVSSPVLSDVTFRYLGDKVDESSLTKIRFRNHNNGSEIVVAGKLNNGTDVSGEVTAQSATGNITLTIYPTIVVTDLFPRPPVIQNASEAGFMERLWAYLTIRQLLDLKEQSDNETVKEQALQLALSYSFVTPLTSLVVVKPNETTSAAGLERTEARDVSGTAGRRLSLHSSSVFIQAHPAPGIASPQQGSTVYYRTSGIPQSSIIDDQTRSASIGRVDRVRSRDYFMVPLSSFTWLEPISNDTHINISVNGVSEILKIGYNETDVSHDSCSSPLNIWSHCRHLPHCALSPLSRDINVYLEYFCKIDDFIGVCCPDAAHWRSSRNSHRVVW